MSVRLQTTTDKKTSSCVTSHFPVGYDSLKWEETRFSDPGGSCQSHGNETQVHYIVERVRISTASAHFETSQLLNAQFETPQGASISSEWVLHTF